MKFFNLDSPLVRFLEKFANLMLLNWIMIICCLPIITIGPAVTAAYWVAMKMVRDEEGGIVQEFFHSFRMNLKQGIVVGLIIVGVFGFLALDIYYIYQLTQFGGMFDRFIFYILIFFAAILSMIVNYVWAVLAKFNNSTRQLFRTSLALTVRHLIASVVMGAIGLIPVAMLLWSSASFVIGISIYLFVGVPGIAYLQSIFMVRIFDQYIPAAGDGDEEEDEENAEEDEDSEEPEELTE